MPTIFQLKKKKGKRGSRASLIPSRIRKVKRYCVLKASAQFEFTEGSAEKLHRETQIKEWNTTVINQSGEKGASRSNTCTEVMWWRAEEPGLWGQLPGLESKLYHVICCVIWGMFNLSVSRIYHQQSKVSTQNLRSSY